VTGYGNLLEVIGWVEEVYTEEEQRRSRKTWAKEKEREGYRRMDGNSAG